MEVWFRGMRRKKGEKKECWGGNKENLLYMRNYKVCSPIVGILNFLRTLCIQICKHKLGQINASRDKPTEPSPAKDTANLRKNSNTFVSLRSWPESSENGNIWIKTRKTNLVREMTCFSTSTPCPPLLRTKWLLPTRRPLWRRNRKNLSTLQST